MLALSPRVFLVQIAAIAGLILLPASVRATTLYVPPPTGTVLSVRASQDQGPPFGSVDFQTFDNFTLAQSANISNVSWQGSYFNSLVANGAFQPPANASQFVVAFYADNVNIPGSLLASYTFSPAQANQTFNRQEAFTLSPTLGLAVYDYQAVLSSSFLALAGTQYWFSVYALEPPASPTEAQWGWNNGLGGNGTAYQTPTGTVNLDRAFTLTGDAIAAVPEPSTLILFATGLAGLARSLRKRSGPNGAK